MSDTAPKGRKFIALLIMVPMWIILLAAIVYLSIWDMVIPDALGWAFVGLTAGFPGYLGVNVLQKKIQAPAPGAS